MVMHIVVVAVSERVLSWAWFGHHLESEAEDDVAFEDEVREVRMGLRDFSFADASILQYILDIIELIVVVARWISIAVLWLFAELNFFLDLNLERANLIIELREHEAATLEQCFQTLEELPHKVIW